MRTGRHEVLLVVGLLLAVVVAFSRPIVLLLERLSAYGAGSGLNLLPAAVIGVLTLLVYIVSQRMQAPGGAAIARQESGVSSADLQFDRGRAHELERLVTFWQALTQSFDLDAIRDVIERYLPELTDSHDGWVVTGTEGHWTSILGPGSVRTDRGDVLVTELAFEALAQSGLSAKPDGIDYQGQVCFPMIAAGVSMGVLGMPLATPSLTAERRLLIGAAAALLGVAVRSANLLQELRENSLRDALTGCVNRAHGMEVVAAELARARRSHLPVSLIMFDLDRFKAINDRHGHLCGDAVLVEVGAKMRAALRTSDLKCRYGGEEFLILLPETPLEGAYRAAETLRRELSNLTIHWHGRVVRVTSSFGVACNRPNEVDPTPLIARADAALYAAKREGRNCVRVAPEPGATIRAVESGPSTTSATQP
jgi:diguanylate cyclase (GGDEF)-like protein